MSENSNIPIYSALDIEKYHKGLLSPEQMHAMEKASLEDPFLSDALEGYGHAGNNIKNDLDDIHAELNSRVKTEKETPVIKMRPWWTNWKVAAMLAVVIGASIMIVQFNGNQKDNGLAKLENSDTSTTTAGTADSTSPSETIPTTTQDQNALSELSTSKETKTPAARSRNDQAPSGAPALPKPVEERKSEKEEDKTSPVLQLDDNNKSEEAIVINKNASKSLQKDSQGKIGGLEIKRMEPKDSNSYIVSNDMKLDPPPSASPNRSVIFDRGDANAKLFRGVIFGEDKKPLPFANIKFNRGKNATHSDVNGYFAVRVQDTLLNLNISYVGFDQKDVVLNNISSINEIVLNPNPKQLDEVAVVGYATQMKKEVTGGKAAKLKTSSVEPVDGWENYQTYLRNNIERPKSGAKGEVVLSFGIDEEGHPVSIIVTRSLNKACDQEAIRLLDEGPAWKSNLSFEKGTLTVIF